MSGVPLSLISCRLKDERQDHDWASHAFCEVFGLGRERAGFVRLMEASVRF